MDFGGGCLLVVSMKNTFVYWCMSPVRRGVWVWSLLSCVCAGVGVNGYEWVSSKITVEPFELKGTMCS